MLTQYNAEEPIKNKYLLYEFVPGTEEEQLNSDIEGIFNTSSPQTRPCGH